MRHYLCVLVVLGYGSVFSQVMPYDDMFFWNKEDIFKNNIQKIAAYEFNDIGDSLIADSNITKGTLQTEEYFDNLGRIIIKKNHYPYSDIGSKKREIAYLGNKVGTFKQFQNNILERSEVYVWNADFMELWHIKEYSYGHEIIYTKQIIRNMLDKPWKEIIKQGKKTISIDSISYSSTHNTESVVRYNLLSKHQTDSTLHHKTKSDTIYFSEIFVAGNLIYKEVHWQYGTELTQRIEEYENGVFKKVYYRRSEKGRIIFEKQIHTVPNLNYDKLYTYSATGMPLKKVVYRNSATPETIVYYKITTN